jgi:hypothetical protein
MGKMMDCTFYYAVVAGIRRNADGYICVFDGDESRPFATPKLAVKRLIKLIENDDITSGHILLDFGNKQIAYVFDVSDAYDFKRDLVNHIVQKVNYYLGK